MPDRLSNRKQLTEAAKLVDAALAELQATVMLYTLPNSYPDFVGLLTRQKAAITNLLADKPAGYELDQLEFSDKSIINTPHLENLEYISREALKLDKDKQETFARQRHVALHFLKSKTAKAYTAYNAISDFLEPAIARGTRPESGERMR